MTDQQAITEFITARLAEDERQAQRVRPNQSPTELRAMVDRGGGTPFLVIDSARILREVEAKRAILTDHLEDHIDHDCAEHLKSVRFEHSGCYAVGQLAAVYSDHQDYQEEWRP